MSKSPSSAPSSTGNPASADEENPALKNPHNRGNSEEGSNLELNDNSAPPPTFDAEYYEGGAYTREELEGLSFQKQAGSLVVVEGNQSTPAPSTTGEADQKEEEYGRGITPTNDNEEEYGFEGFDPTSAPETSTNPALPLGSDNPLNPTNNSRA